MAAFIQKFFGRRKTNEPQIVVPKEPSVAQQEKSGRQDEQRQQQLAALSASPSQSELESLATTGLTADIRLPAAQALTDKESLQRVQKIAKGKDKSVYQAVRHTLQTIRQGEEEQQRREDEIAALVKSATEQARSEDTKLFEARLDALVKRWSELETYASEGKTSEFLQAIHHCRARLDEMKAEKAQHAQAQEQKDQREETLTLLSGTLAELKQQSPDAEPSVASLDALQKTQENRWLEATRDTTVDKQEQKSYESLMLPLRNYISALRRLGQNREAIQSLNADSQSEPDKDTHQATAQELLTAIEWPSEFPVPAILNAVVRQAGKTPKAPAPAKDKTEQKAQTERLVATLDQLEASLEAKQLKESRQFFRTAQQQIKVLDHRHAQPMKAKVQLLGGQLRELEDWQGFATRPKQIALCEQMAYLATQPMEPEAKAERIKEMQNEWRELGGSSDRDLWAQFKQASDKAYEPCKEYFSAKSGLKKANLNTRKTIVEQLRVFVDGADWQTIDWQAAERIHQKAREEWKTAWPIEFRDNRPVQKVFDGLLKQLEEPLNQQREKNESIKQGIVDKAEALIEQEPLAEAMNQAKALQGEWQRVGITRHREDRKLWQAFRKACDQIFARRDAARNEQQAQSRDADEKIRPILDRAAEQQNSQSMDELSATASELTDLSGEPMSNGVKGELKNLQSRLQAQMLTLRGQQKLEKWQEHIQAKASGTLEPSVLPDYWAGLARELEGIDAAEVVIRAEICSELPSPAEEQAQRMEIQVQRLTNGMGGNGAEQQGMGQMEALVAGWCLLPEGQATTKAQADRLADALGAAVSQQS